jgi:predicted transcriptional regulator
MKNPLQEYLDRTDQTASVFSKKSGIPHGTIYNIVNGTFKPSRMTVRKLIKATNGEITLKDYGYS